MRGGKTPYDLAAFLEAESSPEDGKVVLSLTLEPALHNFLRSMHGGAIASAVDVCTTLAIVSAGGFPGVSTSLGVSFLAGCGPGEKIRIEACAAPHQSF